MKMKSSSLKLMSSILISSLLNTSFAGQVSELTLEDQQKALAYISKKNYITGLTQKKVLDLLNFYTSAPLRDSILGINTDLKLKVFSASVKEQNILHKFINLDEIGHNQAKKRNFWENI